MSRNSSDWDAVESAWREAASPVDSLGVLRSVAMRHRRQRLLMLVELLISVALLVLAVIAVREHPGAAVWAWSAALAVHAVALWCIAVRSHTVAQRALLQPTATFLRSWRAACRTQLLTVRAGLTILALEALLLLVLLGNAWTGGSLWGVRIVPAERMWFLSLIVALLTGAALASIR